MLKYPIHVLYATSRTTSTAFEWTMRMRGDMTCFHEPFGLAWYQGSDGRDPTPCVREGHAEVHRPPVFDDFLTRFRQAFLIRDPAKIMTSLHRSYLKNGDTEDLTA